jgi:hypothetical protein
MYRGSSLRKRLITVLAQAAIAKKHRLKSLNCRHLFLTVLEAGISRSRWQCTGFLARDFYLVSRWLTTFLLCSHESVRDRERIISSKKTKNKTLEHPE